MSDVERRGAHRKKVQFSVLCRTGLKQSEATLVDISLTGALLESAILPPPGMIVTIKFAQLEQERTDCPDRQVGSLHVERLRDRVSLPDRGTSETGSRPRMKAKSRRRQQRPSVGDSRAVDTR